MIHLCACYTIVFQERSGTGAEKGNVRVHRGTLCISGLPPPLQYVTRTAYTEHTGRWVALQLFRFRGTVKKGVNWLRLNRNTRFMCGGDLPTVSHCRNRSEFHLSGKADKSIGLVGWSPCITRRLRLCHTVVPTLAHIHTFVVHSDSIIDSSPPSPTHYWQRNSTQSSSWQKHVSKIPWLYISWFSDKQNWPIG